MSRRARQETRLEMDTFIATTDIVVHRRLYVGLVGAAGRKHGLRSSSGSLPRQLSHHLPPLTNSSKGQQFVVHRRGIVLRTQWMVTLTRYGTVMVLRDAGWSSIWEDQPGLEGLPF